MIRAIFLLAAMLLVVPALAQERPLVGDVTNGQKLIKSARVDGTWLNAYNEREAVKRLERGKAGFPKVKSKNALDRWDALAFLQDRNTLLEELFPTGADHALKTYGELDQYAEERLVEAKLKVSDKDKKRTLYAVFDIKDGDTRTIRRVTEKDHKRRDRLKPKKKLGYAVFLPLDIRKGGYEIAIAVSPDVVIQNVIVRDKLGRAPKDLNQAAARFVGKGVRGKYEPLRAGGRGKAIREIQSALSSAYLRAMEAVYMYEVREREYFAFDDG